MIARSVRDLSQRDTTRLKLAYLAQLPLDAAPGARSWVRRALGLRVAESRRDRHLVADIVRRRHYAARWYARPRTKALSYLADLRGVEPGAAGAAAAVVVALLPGQYHVTRALELHQCEVLTLVRMWRADDLGPAVAPDLMPETLRRVVRGGRGVRSIRDEWCARKLTGGLVAVPRLLATYADPAMGHDGATYLAAGAVACGLSQNGKLLFAWGLDDEARAQLRAFAGAVAERAA